MLFNSVLYLSIHFHIGIWLHVSVHASITAMILDSVPELEPIQQANQYHFYDCI